MQEINEFFPEDALGSKLKGSSDVDKMTFTRLRST